MKCQPNLHVQLQQCVIKRSSLIQHLIILGNIQMAISNADILDAVGSMSVMSLQHFIKEIEEKFGVSAAAVAVAAGWCSGAPAAAAEQTEFNVVLLALASKKLT
jgi:hypothetical protein